MRGFLHKCVDFYCNHFRAVAIGGLAVIPLKMVIEKTHFIETTVVVGALVAVWPVSLPLGTGVLAYQLAGGEVPKIIGEVSLEWNKKD